MSGLEIAFGIVLLVFAVGIIAIVLLQEGQQRNPGVITGGSSDTFLSKHQGRSIDAFLARWTRFISIGFFVFVIVVNIILFFAPGHANANRQEDWNASGVASSITSSLESAPVVGSEATADSQIASATASTSEPASSTPAESGVESTVQNSTPTENSVVASGSASEPETSNPVGSQAN